MDLVDANVLIYALDRNAGAHDEARRWLEQSLSGPSTVGFAWVVLLATIRLTTNPSVFERPLTIGSAVDVARTWLEQPAAVTIEPTTRHLDLLQGLLNETGAAGNLVNDAHLASLALERGARIVSYDRDFERFGVSSATPGELVR